MKASDHFLELAQQFARRRHNAGRAQKNRSNAPNNLEALEQEVVVNKVWTGISSTVVTPAT